MPYERPNVERFMWKNMSTNAPAAENNLKTFIKSRIEHDDLAAVMSFGKMPADILADTSGYSINLLTQLVDPDGERWPGYSGYRVIWQDGREIVPSQFIKDSLVKGLAAIGIHDEVYLHKDQVFLSQKTAEKMADKMEISRNIMAMDQQKVNVEAFHGAFFGALGLVYKMDAPQLAAALSAKLSKSLNRGITIECMLLDSKPPFYQWRMLAFKPDTVRRDSRTGQFEPFSGQVVQKALEQMFQQRGFPKPIMTSSRLLKEAALMTQTDADSFSERLKNDSDVEKVADIIGQQLLRAQDAARSGRGRR